MVFELSPLVPKDSEMMFGGRKVLLSLWGPGAPFLISIRVTFLVSILYVGQSGALVVPCPLPS